MNRSCLLPLVLMPLAASAQDSPHVTFAAGEYSLEIPYFTLDGKAYAVALQTLPTSDELDFRVDMPTLRPVALAAKDKAAIKKADGICTKTSKAAFLSCAAETEEEFLLQQGVCFNEVGEEAECLAAADEEREEQEEDCDAQFAARLQVCLAVGEDAYDPEFSPELFMSKAEIIANPNPWLPLVPGNEWVYEGEEETITVTVTDETIDIEGITAIVVRDTVHDEEGELIEDTDDWFAQDLDGNVWYLGEISRNYEDGRLSDLEGSWRAGSDGAKAGILFRAEPILDETLRQEFLLGEAEDLGKTLSLTADESAAEAGVDCESACLEVLEFTPIEPDTMELKYYAPGIGHILSIDLESGEREELISYSVSN